MKEGELYIGWATTDITPAGPVILWGQYYDRRSEYVESPLTATACAFESAGVNGAREQAIMVSIDLVWCTAALYKALQRMVAERLDDFDAGRLMVNATHTHSAPNPDITGAYGRQLLEKLAAVVAAAWENRRPAGISNALGYAAVGHNRRVCYADGSAEMYGTTARPDFIGMEGPSDSSVDLLYCWDAAGALTGIIMNVPCPAQVTEAKYFVSADYWSEVRKQLKKKFDREVFLLPQCGAAGDISPRDLTRPYNAGRPNMWDAEGMVEIGERLIQVINETYPAAKESVQFAPVFRHLVKDIRIPKRKVSREEYDQALEVVNEIRSREPADPASPLTAFNRFLAEVKENESTRQYGPWDNKNTDYGILRKKEIALQQYHEHRQEPYYSMNLHAVRLGNIALATNSFELFIDYGFRIKGRSRAAQTMLVQLCNDYADYLPTARALAGGGYSAIANPVGPEGGDALVAATLEAINSLWQE